MTSDSTTHHAQWMAAPPPKNFSNPDESIRMPGADEDLIWMGDDVVARIVQHPGWRWSTDMRAIAGTEWCEAPHFQYHVAGRLHVRMADGTEFEVGPGEITALPSGHDAWVVGDEPVVIVDWAGASTYATDRPAGAAAAASA